MTPRFPQGSRRFCVSAGCGAVLGLFSFSAFAAPAAPPRDDPKQAECVAKHQAGYEKDWDLKLPDWEAACRKGQAPADILQAAKQAFGKRCGERFQASVQAGLLEQPEVDQACGLGKPGESKLLARLRPQEDPQAPRGPPGPQGAEGQEGLTASLGKTAGSIGGLGSALNSRISSGRIGEIYGERPLGEGSLSVSAADIAAVNGAGNPRSERGGGAAALLKTPVAPPPPKGLKIGSVPLPNPLAPEDPNKRIDRLPYDPQIKALLKTYVQNADEADVRTTLGTIEKYKPSIRVHPDGIQGAFGHAWTEGKGSKRRSFIELSPGYVTAKGTDEELPLNTKAYNSFADQQAKDGSPLGLKTVPLAISKPNGPRKDLGLIDGRRVYEYADGSRLNLYPEVGQAGTLAHEVNHVKRSGEGGSANDYTNERDAHNMQYRFFTRYQQNHGGEIPLDKTRLDRLRMWQQHPKQFNDDMVKRYSQEGGQITPGEVTIAEQQAAAQKRLAAAQAAAGSESVLSATLRRLRGGTTAEEQQLTRARLELSQLDRDKLLSARALEQQLKWRQSAETSFAAIVNNNAETERARIQADAKLTKPQKASALAELEKTRTEMLANPWAHIPSVRTR